MRVLAGTLTRKLSSDRQSMVVTQADTFGGSLSVTITRDKDADGNLIGNVTDFVLHGHYGAAPLRHQYLFLTEILNAVTGDSRQFVPHGTEIKYVFSDKDECEFYLLSRSFTNKSQCDRIEYSGKAPGCLFSGDETNDDKSHRCSIAASYSSYMAPKLHIAFIDEVESLSC